MRESGCTVEAIIREEGVRAVAAVGGRRVALGKSPDREGSCAVCTGV